MDVQIESKRLEKTFPRWRVWKSDSGTWWAAFSGQWKLSRENHGCMPHLHAESAERLELLLKKHDGCEKCWGPK